MDQNIQEKEKKIYKRSLDPDFKITDVSKRTRMRWAALKTSATIPVFLIRIYG